MGTHYMSSPTGVRLTLKFNFGQQIRMCGWTESYDMSYADLPTAIASIANIQAFMLDRCYCLGIGPILVEAVLSAYVQPFPVGAPPLRRSTLSVPVPTYPTPGNAYNKALSKGPVDGKLEDAADFGNTVYYITLQTNLSTSPVYHRNCWIAGMPDTSDETDSAAVVDPDTWVPIKRFLNDLSNGNYLGGIPSNGAKNGVSVRSIDRSAGNPIKQCTAWNIAVGSYTVPAHGFVVNQPVQAEGMKTTFGGSCPRGRYLIATVIDANTITLQGAGLPTAPLKTGGFRAATYVFNQVQIATPNGFTKRNKGRPSGLSVGRRPRQLIKRA
jgi:hypothetical protein